MNAVLKDIKFSSVENIIVMYFSKIGENELYPYRTTLSTQFSKGASVVTFMESKELQKKAKKEALSEIGNVFNVNLYKLSVSELTNGRFKAISRFVSGGMVDIDGTCDYDWKEINEILVASYKSKDDVIKDELYKLCIAGMNDDALGIDQDGNEVELDYTLVFKPTQFTLQIPYDKFPDITDDFIILQAPIELIMDGYGLALSLKNYGVGRIDKADVMMQLEKYRKYVSDLNYRNNTLLKIMCFWQSKEVAKPFVIETVRAKMTTDDSLRLLSDCYILAKSFPDACRKANDDLRKESLHEMMRILGDPKSIIDDMTEFNKEQNLKYKGMRVLRKV